MPRLKKPKVKRLLPPREKGFEGAGLGTPIRKVFFHSFNMVLGIGQVGSYPQNYTQVWITGVDSLPPANLKRRTSSPGDKQGINISESSFTLILKGFQVLFIPWRFVDDRFS
jgi:hypothetical protein